MIEVRPGYLSVVKARAVEYARTSGALLIPFDPLPETFAALRDATVETGLEPTEVWCASGSGVIVRGLSLGWTSAVFHVVRVGAEMAPADLPRGAIVYPSGYSYETAVPRTTPFPADPHYESKAWLVMLAELRRRPRDVVFWNVARPAAP